LTDDDEMAKKRGLKRTDENIPVRPEEPRRFVFSRIILFILISSVVIMCAFIHLERIELNPTFTLAGSESKVIFSPNPLTGERHTFLDAKALAATHIIAKTHSRYIIKAPINSYILKA